MYINRAEARLMGGTWIDIVLVENQVSSGSKWAMERLKLPKSINIKE